MPCLAVARYRILTSIRSANWVFGVSLVAVLLLYDTVLMMVRPPGVAAIGGSIFTSESVFRQAPEFTLSSAAMFALLAFVMHLFIMVAACMLFGANRRKSETALTADLMDTAPITPSARFWGDALGIFASAMIVHLCILPLLAMAIVLSPLGLTAFFSFELLIITALLLASTAASWKLRAENSRWAHTRMMRSGALFTIALIIILISNSRWEDLRDTAFMCLNEPSSQRWALVMGTINNPPLMFSWLFLLYAGFMTFYYLHGVRSHAQR